MLCKAGGVRVPSDLLEVVEDSAGRSMNEAQLATYYDDQKARGSAAHARKQGLGFVPDG